MKKATRTPKTLYVAVRRVEITDEMVHEWCNEISWWYNIRLTPEQMLKVILESENADNFLLDAAEEFETGMRESLINMVSQHLVGEDWPWRTDSRADSKAKEIKAAARAKGYKAG